ncbi:MAG TPA: FlgO family outer membrane protein, partial [Chthoniobacterales bacterium]
VFAWVYEITPEGLKRTDEVDPAESITHRTGRKLTAFTVAIVAIALAVILFEFLRAKPVALAPGVHERSVRSVEIPEKSIAVLPFANLSDDKQNAFFAEGVQDEVLTYLAKVADLKVISRTSVMQYKTGVARNPREIGKQLGVAHLLEGNVQRAANRIRVNAQLIDARTDAHVWAQTYDRDLADVFAIQSEIAKTIADQLRAEISPTEKAAIEQPPTADLTAFDLYTRAKTLLLTTTFSATAKGNLSRAVESLNQAVARDPNFFLAYCQLASAHDSIYFLTDDHTPARRALADAAVRNAARLRPDAGETHLAQADHLYRCYLDYDRARTQLALAKRALPNSAQVFELTGYIDRRQAHWDDAARNLEKALELDPRNFFILQQISLSYYYLRHYPEMAAALDRALVLVPGDVDTRVRRALVELDWRANPRPMNETIHAILSENPSAAESVADQWLFVALCEHDPAEAKRALGSISPEGITTEGVNFARTFCEALAARARGDGAAARDAFTRARTETERAVREQPDYGPPLCVLGMIDAALGRKEEAIREGGRACELLPIAKDSINGAEMMKYLAVIYAWTGEKDRAIEQVSATLQVPGDLSYGQLKLHPYWESLQGDPRFEKIVAAIAPASAAK